MDKTEEQTGSAGIGGSESNSETQKLSTRDHLMQAVKFTLLSISAGGVEAASFGLLDMLTPWSPAVRHAISLILSVLYNFTLNRRFTFKSANNVPIAMLKVALFYAFFVPASTWWTHGLTGIGWNDWLVKLITMLSNFTGEFLWWKFIVFRGSVNTRK
jgi:putative flippase GtrA